MLKLPDGAELAFRIEATDVFGRRFAINVYGAGRRGWYRPHRHSDHEPETRAALDLIFSDHFSRNEPGIFAPLRDTPLTHGDFYMLLADLPS